MQKSCFVQARAVETSPPRRKTKMMKKKVLILVSLTVDKITHVGYITTGFVDGEEWVWEDVHAIHYFCELHRPRYDSISSNKYGNCNCKV